MNDYDTYLHKLVERENEKNLLNYKACRRCGDTGRYFEIRDTGLDYNAVYLVPCECGTGRNLVERWSRKDEQGKAHTSR